MKKIITLLLCFVLLLCGCAVETGGDVSQNKQDTVAFEGMSDPKLLPYISDQVYESLTDELDGEEYVVEDVQTRYVSKEYIEENEYNSKENIYFGYTLSQIAEQFEGKNYVFALDESGKTVVQELVEYDDTYDKMIKNVLIGSGAIFVCVTVALLTKNPAMAVGASKTVKLIFAMSSTAAKEASINALATAAISGVSSGVLEAFKTDDVNQILKKSLLQASEGFKIGAIFGTVKGAVDGITIVNNTHYFPESNPLSAKYPEGVLFEKGKDGVMYPRFDKWAKATAKFKTPTSESVLNHTTLSGNRYYDTKLANAQCGFSQTPDGYVWHHVEDMQTMQLVPRDLHDAISHKGGVSKILKKFAAELAAAEAA